MSARTSIAFGLLLAVACVGCRSAGTGTAGRDPPTSNAAATTAWWLDARFRADCTEGASSTALQWRGHCIRLLSNADLQTVQGYSPADMTHQSATLRTRLRTGEGKRYVAVGVFRDADGTAGRALVIARDDALTDVEDVRFVSGGAGFSALVVAKDKLYWTFCLDCGDFEFMLAGKPF